MITTHPKHRILKIAMLALLLVACSDNKSELLNYINDIKSRPSRSIEPIPEIQPLPIYKFPESADRRNPFKPVDVKKRNEVFAPDSDRKKEPLESFPLDALKYVGTLKETDQVWGLIQQPDKQIVRVKIGDYMGQNYGKVIEIKNDFIKLQETVKISGVWEHQTITMNLYLGK